MIESSECEAIKRICQEANHLNKVVDVFNKNLYKFSSSKNTYNSNEVLKRLGEIEGYKKETSKKEE